MISREQLSSILNVDYTDDQLEAITAPSEPMLIVAGAGSGKTAVMAARVVWLVGTGQVAPENVLGLTFTNKAAASLSARITRALEAAQLVDPSEPGPVVSTYHSFAGQVISDYGLRVGVEPHARIITDAARAQLALRVVRRTALPLAALTGKPIKLVSKVLRLDDALAEQGLEPSVLDLYDADLIAAVDSLDKTTLDIREVRQTALERRELAALVGEFRAAKKASDLIDFADQIRLARDIVASQSDVVSILRDQHAAVLLDEYQDTSVAQRQLLWFGFGGGHSVTAVGDPLQAIYGWRGASVDNIDSFPRHFARADGQPARLLSLAANMRSGGNILAAANVVAHDLRAVHDNVRPLTQGNPSRGTGSVVVSLHETWADEVAYLVEQISAALATHKPEDIAVLARRGSELVDLDAALGAAGIPTTIADLDGLLAVPEIVDLVSMLEVLNDPTANIALLRLLQGPRWALGHRDLVYLARHASRLATATHTDVNDDATLGERVAAELVTDPVDVVALVDAVDDAAAADVTTECAQRCAEFSRQLRYLRRFVDEPLHDLVSRVAAVTGLDLEIASSPTLVARNRAAVVSSFVDLAANFAGLDGEATLEAFLAWLHEGDELSAVPTLTIPPAPGAVQLLTVHRAKGLEWPLVVLPAVCQKVFPSDRSRSRYISNPEALPHELRDDRESLPPDPELSNKSLAAFVDQMKEQSLLEELRLGYVAATRAESTLIASGHWWGPSQKIARGPSVILEDLREAVLSGAGSVATWCAAPDDDTANPALDEQRIVPYVTTLNSPEAQRRRDLAHLVNECLQQGAPTPTADDAVLVALDADIEAVVARLRADRSHVRHVALPASLTASQVQALADDADAFALRLARPMPAAPRAAAARGSEFHRVLERRYAAAALIDLDDLLGAADPAVESVDVTRLVAAFDASAWAQRVPRAVEWPFALTIGGRLIRGRVDAVFAGASVPLTEVPLAAGLDPSESVVLIDWKTSRAGSADPLQLAVYREAWARAHGVDPLLVRVAFVHWPSGDVVAPGDIADSATLSALLAP